MKCIKNKLEIFGNNMTIIANFYYIVFDMILIVLEGFVFFSRPIDPAYLYLVAGCYN